MIAGQTMFNFMIEATNNAVWSITGNASLLKKTYVPKYIFTLSKVGSSLVNLVFSLGALVLVMVFTGAEFSWNLLYFPIIILQVLIFSLGISLFLAAATVFFRDIVLYAKAPDFNSMLVGFIVAFGFLILGAWYFNKKQDEFILYI